MKTFILIHGSWHSSWNWHKVIPILEKEGYKVHAINLPGMGRDKTPIQEVKMAITIQKIVDLLDSITEKVILAGHSKNDVLISQAAEYRPDKIEKLVYLAGLSYSKWQNTTGIFNSGHAGLAKALCHYS